VLLRDARVNEFAPRGMPMSRFTAEMNQAGPRRVEKKKGGLYGTRANYAALACARARACASPRPPNGQFVFADCLYLGTLSRPEIAVSSFHLGRKERIRSAREGERGRDQGRDVDQIRAASSPSRMLALVGIESKVAKCCLQRNGLNRDFVRRFTARTRYRALCVIAIARPRV